MTKENQKKLYKHYMNLSKEGETDKQRAFGLESANDILKSWPEFEKGTDADGQPNPPEVNVVPKGTKVDLTKEKKVG